MSLTFSSYTSKDNTKNGYFRIGFVILDIPPSDIITDRITNNDRKVVLRGKNEMFIKSGQSRWDVTITWIALKNGDDVSQWEKVRDITAMFHAAPFVEVENQYLRQIFAEDDSSMKNARLAFGMRQLKITNHPDIIDGLIVNLTLTYFNYQPYTTNFGYLGDKNQPVDAYNSTLFQLYISTWKSANLIANWESKDPGKFAINWKRYKPVFTKPESSISSVTGTAALAPVPQKTYVPSGKTKTLGGVTLSVFAAAIAQSEGFGTAGTIPTRANNPGDLAIGDQGYGTLGQKITVFPDATTGAAALERQISLIQSGTSKSFSLNMTIAQFGAKYSSDPNTNLSTNIARILGVSASTPLSQILSSTSTTTVPSIMPSLSTQPTQPGQTNPDTDNILVALIPKVAELESQGWQFDHAIEGTAFMYRDETVTIAKNAGAFTPLAGSIVASQITVLFVNNLAQIPLAGYQYPTYQHIGPASGTISIQMTSIGDTSNGEPVHAGLSELTSMMHTLEDQYRALRTTFRNPKSIHGMEAVTVDNDILNMLGISGILPEQASTELVDSSSNMIQVNFVACKYENTFEEIEPYKINGITGAYITAIQNIVSIGSINSLNANEKSSISKVTQFQSDYDSKSASALGTWLLDAASSKDNVDFIAGLTNNPTLNLSSIQFTELTQYLDARLGSYPVLASRLQKIIASKSMTLADYYAIKVIDTTIPSGSLFQLANLSDLGDPTTQVSHLSSVIGQIYLDIIPSLANSDTLFATGLQNLISSPSYKSQISGQTSPDNPSKSNPGHGAYKDLGLKTDTLAGLDLNPAMYFYNNKADYYQYAKTSLQSTMATNNSTTTAVNNTSAQPITTTTGLPTDPNQVLSMVTIPGYSLAEAFPTFKLFFMEDANAGIFYAFDEFYSYSSVLEMEVIRSYDKPATAVIRLTNISNILSHKVFDNSLVGKYNKNLYPYETIANNTEASTNPNTSIVVNRNPFTGVTNQGNDFQEGFGTTTKRIPIKYFPLQTGTKIQIRQGFKNDPDELTAVFNGLVTQIEEGDPGEIVITAQSFLVEIANVSAVSASNTDSWFSLDLFTRQGKGTAYGGSGIFTDGGDAQSVIRHLLSNPAAKHFGHWQINSTAPDQALKGFSNWKELLVASANATGNPNLGAAINNSYDRSGDNIMVNHYTNYTGATVNARGQRSFYDQATGHPFNAISGSFDYHVDAKLTMSLWELIKDVSRRYPEYVLLEKFYGFPYEADSTLVFANPLDWYYSRNQMIGDDEATRAATKDIPTYQDWYNSVGRALFQKALNDYFTIINILVVGLLEKAINNVTGITNSYLNQAAPSYAALDNTIAQIISSSDFWRGGSLIHTQGDDRLVNARKSLLEFKNSYLVYVKQKSGSVPTNSDILRPVRKFHFIDKQTIIHNNITINDKMYNAVRIMDPSNGKDNRVTASNPNIPSQYLRVLDVTDRINDPAQNVIGQGLRAQYAQSFLREEIGKMYRGEIILRCVPEIEPMDVLILLDPSTGIIGPVEVEQVIHSFSQEMGAITIVKPRMMVVVNETASNSLFNNLVTSMAYGLHLLDRGDPTLNAFGGALAGGQFSPFAIVGYAIANSTFNEYPLILQPLTRFNRPWVGGLQGWQTTSIIGHFGQKFEDFKADEIYPFMDLYKQHNQISN